MSEQPKNWEDVHRELQREIISGQRHPRERLVEDEIIARTGATRHAVRIAFAELEKTGLVIRERNKGVHVRDYSIREIEELYEIRECLECQAARRFTRPAPAETIAALTDIATRHRDASRDQRFGDVFELNNRFHETLYQAAGNRQLADAIQHYTFATHPIRTRAFTSREIREVAIAEHFEMIETLAAGDAAGLCGIIPRHIGRPKDFYLRANYIGEYADPA
ncbi:GntR family transcriptional regulator [Martelella soudanensis]|uniref:GntR family transcriptional regulator n=1 Tax=unclassified Martelella TaxID=2629616 RepID=UPI0015DFE9C5|nr:MULTISPECIES: GntR family transcriptional regulator [unclassified Martelella]